MILEPEGFIDIRGWKALGKPLPFARVKDIKLLSPKVVTGPAKAVITSEPAGSNGAEIDEKELVQLGLFS